MSKTMEQCREIARRAVRDELSRLSPWPSNLDREIVLGSRLQDGHWVCELYVPGTRPEDAVVLARALVDPAIGSVEATAFPEHWTPDEFTGT